MKRALLLLTLAACEPETAPATPHHPPAPTVAPGPTAMPPAPTAKVDAEPTKLDAAEVARDRELAKKIDPILDAFGNLDPRLSPDGKKVAFRSNRDGVPELFVADPTKPAEPAKKIVPGPERVEAARWTPDGKWILFTRDEGADENFRIYRVKPDGSDLAVVTAGDKLHREEPFVPRTKPSTIYFSSRDPKSPETHVEVINVDGTGGKRIYTDPAPGGLAGVTSDGAHALYLRFSSPSDQILFDVDLGTGKAK